MLIRRTLIPRIMTGMNTPRILTEHERPATRASSSRAVLAGAVLCSVVGLSTFATSAAANEFYPVPSSSFASSCNGPKGINEITLVNNGTDTAHFTIQWNLDWTTGTDLVDVVPGTPVTKTYFPLEGHYASYDISAPGQPAWTSHATTFTDCVPSPIGVITLVCPSDGSSAFMRYAYSNHSTVGLQYEFGYPNGTTSSEQVNASSGDPIKMFPVAEDTDVTGFIKAGGQTLSSFTQHVNCLPPIPATTIPDTTIPATTIPATTVPDSPIPATTVPPTEPPTTAIAVLAPVIKRHAPTTPLPTAFVPGATRLPATGSTPAAVAILAGSTLVVGAILLALTARRRPRSRHTR